LVVGCSAWAADEQGTPVQVRDGPAAVTVDVGSPPSLLGHCREQADPLARACDEKAGTSDAEVRRPTNAVAGVTCEGG
jgi:hypothetical protein